MRLTGSALPCNGQPLANSDMYAADQTLTAGQNLTTPGDAIKTNGADTVLLYPKATGANASSSTTALVTFYISQSYDGVTFTGPGIPIYMTLNGNTARIGDPWQFDTRNVMALKVLSIVNGDASYGLSAVNVHALSLQ